MKFVLNIAAALMVSACLAEAPRDIEVIKAPSGMSEVAFAKATLNRLQTVSFASNREYCGYILRAPDGSLAATPASKGKVSSCCGAEAAEGYLVVASFHTHGAFEYDTPAEFPSVGDVEADEAEDVDGYISTPGGRFWYVDGSELEVSQICGVGCMAQDQNFEAGLDGRIEVSYSLEELRGL